MKAEQVTLNSGDNWLDAGAPTSVLANPNDGRWLFAGGDELFRAIYTRAGAGFAPEVLAICSGLAGEGRTTVAVGLAVALAQDFPDKRVLLVETDLQRPVLADDFAVEPAPGLLECLVNDEPLQNACRPTVLDNLHIVPGGGAVEVLGRPLRSSRMAAVVDAMRRNYQFVILDLPPLLVNSDAALLTDFADGMLCVVRAGVTPVAVVNRALEQLELSKLRGIVLNAGESSVPRWLRRTFGL